MNTKLVKSTVVKSLVAGAMLAATAPLDAIADEGKSTSDYVQDGLVAQWDGVENAGVGLHEDSPSAWVDIVGGLEIAIPEWVTVETNAFYSESSTATRTYPSISSIPGLGDNVTIEVVAERVLWRAKDNYKNLQRIMSSPYTDDNYDFKAEAVLHSVTVITVFMILLLLALFVTERAVDKMFKPLSEIGQKMNEADINNLEYIIYEREDEVSSLVRAYNLMVHDLYDSTRQLTQAERDKAWATMARQVAHEIKNPLTSIKRSKGSSA